MQTYEIPILVYGWLAGTLAGVAGFGSALLLLPLLTFQVGVRRAIPILTVAQLMGNLSRAGFGWRDIHWKPALIFCLGAVPASLMGARIFAAAASDTLSGVVGVVLLAVLCFRHSSLSGRRFPERLLAPAGAVVGGLSAVAGSVGPLGAAVFLSLELPASDYVATEAVTAVLIHLTKCLAYHRLTALTTEDLGEGIVLGGALIMGAWTGRILLSRIPPRAFTIIVESVLFISAVSLVFLGVASHSGAFRWKD